MLLSTLVMMKGKGVNAYASSHPLRGRVGNGLRNALFQRHRGGRRREQGHQDTDTGELNHYR